MDPGLGTRGPWAVGTMTVVILIILIIIIIIIVIIIITWCVVCIASYLIRM